MFRSLKGLKPYLTLFPILLTTSFVYCRPGASSTSPTPLATTLQSSDTGGCLVSFTGPNEDIPVQTSGSTVLPPFSSGGPSQTVPCSKFLAYILHVANSQNDTLPNTAHAPSSTRTTSSVDSEQHANASPNSSQSSVTAEISRDASSAIARATLSPSTALPTTTWNSSLYECPSITASISVPVFTDHNLEGCYAGTGGSTSFRYTVTGTEIVNHSFVESETYATGPCSDFMQVDSVPSPIAKPFQRSPICTSYVNWYKDNVCSAGPSVDSPVKLPPGVYNEHLWNSYECCGGCNILDPPHVSILYWPPDTTSECFNSGASTQTQAPRPVSLDPQSNSGGVTATGGETIAVLDGMTLTYPSLYLAFSGTLQVTDRCGPLGSAYVNPTIAVPSGSLSTLSYNVPFIIQEGVTTGAFDPAACRTYGASNGTVTSSYNSDYSTWYTYSGVYTMGPPYNPILVPPKEVLNYDPAWAACTTWYHSGEENGGFTFGIYDPPRMLTPVVVGASPPTAMAGSTTQHVQWGTPTPSARPGSASMPDGPRVTSNVPNPGDPTGNTPLDPALPNDPKQGGVGSSSQDIDPLVAPIGNGNSGNGGNIQDPSGSGGKAQSSSGKAGGANQDPKPPDQGSTENHPGDPAAHNPEPADPLKNPVDTQPKPVLGFEVGKSVIGVNTDPVYHVGSKTLMPAGPAVTINNVPYALAPSANAIIAGTKTIPLQPPPAGKLPDIEIGGKTYVANKASEYIVGDQTLRPNGPPAIIDHVTYSIAPSASALLSNGHTMTLAPNHQDSSAPIIIDNQSFSPDTRPRITIHGQEIVAGAPSITINKTPYALAPAGDTLIAGTSTITLQTHTVPASQPATDMALIIPNPSSSTAPLSTIPISRPSSPENPNLAAVLTLNGETYTAADDGTSSRFIIGSQTLVPGGPAITVAGTPYSLQLLPTSLPSPLSSTSPSQTPTPYAVITLNGHPYTCTRNANCTIASQTLTPNGTIVVGGQTVRYGDEGIDVVATAQGTQSGGGEGEGQVITSHVSGLTPLVEATATGTGGGAGPTGAEGKKKSGAAVGGGIVGAGGMVWVAVVVGVLCCG